MNDIVCPATTEPSYIAPEAPCFVTTLCDCAVDITYLQTFSNDVHCATCGQLTCKDCLYFYAGDCRACNYKKDGRLATVARGLVVTQEIYCEGKKAEFEYIPGSQIGIWFQLGDAHPAFYYRLPSWIAPHLARFLSENCVDKKGCDFPTGRQSECWR